MRTPWLLVIPALLWPRPSAAQGTPVISGTVTDIAGNPIEGVTVSLERSRESWVLRNITDARGHFVLVGVPTEGAYDLVARRLGYYDFRRPNTKGKAGHALIVNFTMFVNPVALEPVTVKVRRRLSGSSWRPSPRTNSGGGATSSRRRTSSASYGPPPSRYGRKSAATTRGRSSSIRPGWTSSPMRRPFRPSRATCPMWAGFMGGLGAYWGTRPKPSWRFSAASAPMRSTRSRFTRAPTAGYRFATGTPSGSRRSERTGWPGRVRGHLRRQSSNARERNSTARVTAWRSDGKSCPPPS